MGVRLPLSQARKLGLAAGPRRRATPGMPAARRLPPPNGPVAFVVPGKAVPKERAQIVATGPYTPKRTGDFTRKVETYAQMAMALRAPFTGPLTVRVEFVVEVPVSWPKAKQAAALAGQVWPTVRPDVDNVAKAVLDAMNKVVFADDAQICDKTVRKTYGAVAEVRVWVAPLEGWACQEFSAGSAVEIDVNSAV